VRPGRNIATLIEVAARNQLLKAQGIHLRAHFAIDLTARARPMHCYSLPAA
jgi:serine kinase of HPr protein (carbohydrate metabolism regulator)